MTCSGGTLIVEYTQSPLVLLIYTYPVCARKLRCDPKDHHAEDSTAGRTDFVCGVALAFMACLNFVSVFSHPRPRVLSAATTILKPNRMSENASDVPIQESIEDYLSRSLYIFAGPTRSPATWNRNAVMEQFPPGGMYVPSLLAHVVIE